jgi:hypothetical protein
MAGVGQMLRNESDTSSSTNATTNVIQRRSDCTVLIMATLRRVPPEPDGIDQK